MPNSIRTPRQGTTITSQRIAEAVDNEEWQKFRVSMKGETTRGKLNMLREYYEDVLSNQGGVGVPSIEDMKIRSDNYIKALCRGGLLYPGCDLFIMIESCWSSNWIKR